LARKILLADDSVTAQNMGRRILMEAGYEVITVNNGSAALKRIAESKPDLIVLDVYMPGYGGLEVCQRVRETPETARIPVLLTVGKLEPFKVDDVRRVRADAYIVKPFEASELLTALTKLEDKIVPQAQPYKPGRFAKAIAAVEESYTGKEFGNPETGWKSRLAIPPHAPKQAEPEVGAVQASREEQKPAVPAAHREDDTSLRESASPVPEIAARVDESKVESTEEKFAPAAEEQPKVSPAKPPEVPVSHEAEFAVTAEEMRPDLEMVPPVAADPLLVPNVMSTEPAAVLPSSDADNGKLADDEVTAALASLAPAYQDRDSAAASFKQESESWTSEQVLATMAATAGAAPQYSGPRWIAEPVAVSEDESALILEQEMAKAYAAFTADNPWQTADPWPAENTASVENSSEQREEPVPAESAAISDTPAAPPIEQATAEPAFVANEAPEPAQSAEPDEVQEPAIACAAEPVDEPVKGEASAFAAAASAGASETGSPATIGPSITGEETAMPAKPAEYHQESELAAAWANWKQIRESVLGAELPSQPPAAGFHEIRPAETAAIATPQASDSTDDEVTAIASIVDSVLADLKPKLMEEIAKKMGKDKKK